jgi:hypothetical protein
MVKSTGYSFKYKNYQVLVYNKRIEVFEKLNWSGKPDLIIETNENYNDWMQDGELFLYPHSKQDEYKRIIKIMNI